MKIAINALSARIGGGVVFLQNIIPNLAKLDSSNEYFLFVSDKNIDIIFGSVELPENVKIVKIRTVNLIMRLFLEQLLLPYLIWKHKINILICSANISSFLAPCKKILWVLNIYPYFNINIKIERETFLEKLRRSMLKMLSTLSIRFSDLSIFISDFSKELVVKSVKINPGKALTIYLGVSMADFSVKEGGDLKRDYDYILSVSSISKRKNYKVLMEAYNELCPAIKNKYRIVLIGNINEKLKSYLLQHVKGEALQEKIIFKGEVSFEELCLSYKKASLFVLPSLVEAFGLPVIEAMAAGLPVLVADATSLPEVAGEAGMRFDLHDPVDLARKIERILTDRELASSMSRRGIERAKGFTWENTAKKLIESYSKIVGEN